MAEVLIDHPSWARVEGEAIRGLGFVRDLLTYKDSQVEYEIRRFKKSEYRLRRWKGGEAYEDELADLQARRKACLVREDGAFPSGLAPYVAQNLGCIPIRDSIAAPAPRPLPWKAPLPFEPRPYQVEGVRQLIAARHGTLELCTGAGKTLVIAMLCRELGLRTMVTSPFSVIVRQTEAFLARHLGPAAVGVYGDGSHRLDRPVTVATAQALQRIKPGSVEADQLAQIDVLCVDEAHMFAADTLRQVCVDLMGEAPYRFFLTGTHLRGDGRQLMLDGLTGPILSRLTVREAVDQGWLARPSFRVLQFEGGLVARKGEEPSDATRRMLLMAPKVVATVADVVNRLLRAGRPTLVLVEEVSQFPLLLPYLKYEARLAYGGMPSDKKAKTRLQKSLPQEFWKSDPLALVEEFNAGRFPLLVGTSAVGTGVDVRAAAGGVYWRGGQSETDLRQGIGRFLRLAPGKTDTVVYDLDPIDAGLVHNHARKRAELLQEIYPDYAETFVGPRFMT